MEQESAGCELNAKTHGSEIEVREWEVSEAAAVAIGHVNQDTDEQE